MMLEIWRLLPRPKETRRARGWHRTGYASYSKVCVCVCVCVLITNLLLVTNLSLTQNKSVLYFLEMKPLESHPMFNPALKVVDVTQKEKKVLPAKDDKEGITFSLFEQAEKEPPAEKGTSGKKTKFNLFICLTKHIHLLFLHYKY